MSPIRPDILREQALAARGYRVVAGIDEAGRGPLAGPVVAAAVVLDLARVPEGLADSKLLSADTRERLFALILAQARAVAVAQVSPATIDRIDIRQATLLAMRRAAFGLAMPPDIALVDGNDPPPLSCPVETVVKGDAQIASIAAASIIAKVTRDRIMARLDGVFPVYGFARHAGYATAAHRAALQRHGPCPLHRLTFRSAKVTET